MDIVITVPKEERKNFEKEVADMKEKGLSKLFKVSQAPRMLEKDDSVFIVLDGRVRYRGIFAKVQENDFECESTGRKWQGQFLEIVDIKEIKISRQREMQGFQGFRYRNWGMAK